MHFTIAFGATVDRVLIGGANQNNFGHTRELSRDGNMAPHHNQLVYDNRVPLVVLLLDEGGVPCSQCFPLLGFPGYTAGLVRPPQATLLRHRCCRLNVPNTLHCMIAAESRFGVGSGIDATMQAIVHECIRTVVPNSRCYA